MVKVENEAPARWRKPPENRYSLHPRQARLSPTLPGVKYIDQSSRLVVKALGGHSISYKLTDSTGHLDQLPHCDRHFFSASTITFLGIPKLSASIVQARCRRDVTFV